MKKNSLILCLWAASTALSLAQVPKVRPIYQYNHLWQNSPVTEKEVKEIEDPAPVVSELDDYVMVGVERSTQGVQVNLEHKKDKTAGPLFVSSWNPNSKFKIVKASLDTGYSYKNTVVTLNDGIKNSEFTFDEKNLVLKNTGANAKLQANPKKAQKTNQARPPVPPNPGTGNTNNTQKPTKTRAPRVRYVPKPKK